MPFVLEGLVTTTDESGACHLAPMGPHISGDDFRELELRPFPTSQTLENLRRHSEGVLHTTDDVLLLAQAAIGAVDPTPPTEPARSIRGFVLADCCRYFEFRVASFDDSHERVRIKAEVVASGRRRDFLGFNRARNAVLEAAILATRRAILPADAIRAEFERLSVIVQKTGGEREIAAFQLLTDFVRQA